MGKRKVIAIIPARAGSKRIPNKNVHELGGRPMIAWTIEAAIKSSLFTDILVSTDGDGIAQLSKSLGARVPFLRRGNDADDYSPVWVATTNALIQMENYTVQKYDIVVQLMPNCPCRSASDIVRAYNHFLSLDTNFQISVFKFGWMNPWWAMRLNDKTMRPDPIFPEALKKRSQDLDDLYCPSGAIWIAKADALKREKTFYGENYSVFPIDWQSALDIDEKDDLEMAEAVFNLRRGI